MGSPDPTVSDAIAWSAIRHSPSRTSSRLTRHWTSPSRSTPCTSSGLSGRSPRRQLGRRGHPWHPDVAAPRAGHPPPEGRGQGCCLLDRSHLAIGRTEEIFVLPVPPHLIQVRRVTCCVLPCPLGDMSVRGHPCRRRSVSAPSRLKEVGRGDEPPSIFSPHSSVLRSREQSV